MENKTQRKLSFIPIINNGAELYSLIKKSETTLIDFESVNTAEGRKISYYLEEKIREDIDMIAYLTPSDHLDSENKYDEYILGLKASSFEVFAKITQYKNRDNDFKFNCLVVKILPKSENKIKHNGIEGIFTIIPPNQNIYFI